MTRQHSASVTPWSRAIGYSRAVRTGPLVEVSGCSSADSTGTVHGATTAEQYRRCLDSLETALADLGATLSDVTRTRTYLHRIDDWEECAPVHLAAFSEVLPACSFFGNVTFVDESMLVEIEATAWIEGSP